MAEQKQTYDFNSMMQELAEVEAMPPAQETGLAIGREMALPVAAPQPTRLPGQVSSAEAFGRGALAGVTSDFDEELGAAYQTYLEALRRKVESTGAGRVALEALGFGVTPTQTMAGGKVYTPEEEDLTQFYREGREMGRLEKERAQASAPKAYLGGQVVGAVGQAALLQGLGVPVATPAGAVGMGALQGLGASEADLTKGELGQAALDTATGAAFGAAGYGLGKGLEKAAPVVGQQLSKAAEKVGLTKALRKVGDKLDDALKSFESALNVKATGAIQSDIAKYSKARLQRIGQVLSEEDIIPALGNKQEMGRRAVSLQRASTKAMDEIYDLADDAAKAGGLEQPFNYDALESAVEKFRQSQSTTRQIETKRAFDKFREALEGTDEVIGLKNKPSSFKSTSIEKSEFAKILKPYEATTTNAQREAAADIERIWNDEIQNQIKNAFDLVAPPQVGDEYLAALQKAKRNFEATMLTKEGKRRAERQFGNNPLGLSAVVVGAPMAAQAAERGLTSATATGLAAAAATEFARRRGSAIAAGLTKAVRQGAPQVAAATRQATARVAQAAQRNPALLGRFAGIIQEAAQRGEKDLAVADYTLANQSEEYRKMREELMKAENE